jgi:hypothetical protein
MINWLTGWAVLIGFVFFVGWLSEQKLSDAAKFSIFVLAISFLLMFYLSGDGGGQSYLREVCRDCDVW